MHENSFIFREKLTFSQNFVIRTLSQSMKVRVGNKRRVKLSDTISLYSVSLYMCRSYEKWMGLGWFIFLLSSCPVCVDSSFTANV